MRSLLSIKHHKRGKYFRGNAKKAMPRTDLSFAFCLRYGELQTPETRARMLYLIAGYADLVVTRATIDGAIILRQERHLRLSSALGTNNCMHLSLSRALTTGRTTATCRSAARSTTTGAAARLIHQTFLLVELLFSCGKHEIISAFTAS
jgi:hypothetical protein